MQKFNQVYTTKDYTLFTSIDGNRTKSKLHLKRLKQSIKENYLFTVIIVNEKYEIIDGQHRFDVIKELNLPLYYIICEGYGLAEVHILNQISKTWTADDHLTGYCDLGYKDYITYARFKQTYGFGHNETMALLTENGTKTERFKEFYAGKLKIKNIVDATQKAEKLLLIGKYYSGYKRRSFMMAMMKLFKNKKFDFEDFMQKLKLQPSMLVHCPSIEQYLDILEQIYNYRRKDKVNLRY